jgi:type IV pilus assembly protein PilE
MKKGFTLLEIIVVLIILGIIATFAFTHYQGVIENGRKAEAKTVLGTIRTAAVAYYEERGSYPDNGYLSSTLNLPTTTCNSDHYFRYTINSSTGVATATRCTSGGKPPQGSSAYTITLSPDGTIGGAW